MERTGGTILVSVLSHAIQGVLAVEDRCQVLSIVRSSGRDHSAPPPGVNTGVTRVDLGINGVPGTDSGFFDSLSVINTAPTITKTFVPTTVPLNDASTLT